MSVRDTNEQELELQNASLCALIGSLFLTWLLYSIVPKGHKTIVKLANGDHCNLPT